MSNHTPILIANHTDSQSVIVSSARSSGRVQRANDLHEIPSQSRCMTLTADALDRRAHPLAVGNLPRANAAQNAR